MKSVVFSGSVKNYDAMKPWADFLENNEVKVELPKIGEDAATWEQLTVSEQRRQKLAFIHDHNKRIDRSDVLFVFNIDGHVGNSVTLEIGYALAQGKKIYAAQEDSEQGRDVVYSGYCKSPNELLKALTVS